jgi:hypothetical protein
MRRSCSWIVSAFKRDPERKGKRTAGGALERAAFVSKNTYR